MPDDAFVKRLFLLTLAATLLIIAYQAAPLVSGFIRAQSVEPRTVTARGDLAADERATIALFEEAKDAVVAVTTRSRVSDFFTGGTYDVPRGTGSGFLWDAFGHVVTNRHVIAGATGATVRLANGETYRAKLVGADPRNDLAVLRISQRTGAAPALPLGTSEGLQVGQKVYAIGNPFGLDWTMTTGIVSALDRELPNGEGGAIRGLIQTDAAINPGNSGGPLIDSAGRLIGVNTAIYSPSGANAGIGFAVPVDTVNRVVPQLIARGRYDPPSIGIVMDRRANQLARRAGLEGILILDVEPDSPAEAAGLEPARMTRSGRLVPGDLLTAVDGRKVRTIDDLMANLDGRDVGDAVELELTRDGRTRTVTVSLADSG